MNIFVSHSHKDSKLAAALTESLRTAGLETWNAETDLLPGDNWFDAANKALERSDAIIFLLSEEAVQSPAIRREFEYAITMPKFRGRVLPVVIGTPSKSLPWIVHKLHHLQLPARMKPEDAARRIVSALPVPVS